MKSHPKLVILALGLASLAGSLAAQSSKPAPAPAAAPAQGGASAGQAAKPKAVPVEAVTDAGTVPKGEKIVHDFELRNEGNAPLQVTDVRPACGCTVASYDKTIAPGKTGKVHVVVDTVNFSGPVNKGVTVYTNDPANPQLELTVHAKIEPFIAVKPGYARYMVVRGEAKEGTIVQTLWTPDGSPMDVVKVESPFPFLTVSFHQAQEGERLPEATGKQWRVEMLLSNEAPVGPLAGYVTVHTTHAKQKLLQIPVSGFVRPVVAVTPPVGDFGNVELKGAPLTQVLNVKSFATEPIKVTGVDQEGKGIQTKFKSVLDGREYEVQVTLSPEVGKGPFHGKLTIHTDSPKTPVIDVELKGTVL
jgi:hypothetical protein